MAGRIPPEDPDSPDGTPLSRKRKRLYAAVGVVISLWLVLTVWAVTTGLPSTIYWFSYYAVDYSYGFVRRGLGGTITALFGQRHYFLVSAVLTWGSVVACIRTHWRCWPGRSCPADDVRSAG